MMPKKCLQVTRGVAALSVLLAAMTPAGAEIYRCSDGETTVFSDLPCTGGAEIHLTEGRVSVVTAPDNLDDIAESNRAFLEQRREALAQQRQRAAQQRRREQQRERRLEAIERTQRYRTVVGHLGNRNFGVSGNTRSDPRSEARRRPDERTDEPARRRTLLSRSGGNQSSIIR